MNQDNLDVPIKVLRITPKSAYTTEEAHRHNYNEFFFFKNGGGDHLIDFVTYTIKANSVYNVVSNKVHYVNRAIDSFGYVLMVKNDFFQNQILKTNYAFLIEFEEINLDVKAFDSQVELIQQIENELKSDHTLKNNVVVALVHLLLVRLKQYVYQNQTKDLIKLTENSLYKSFYVLLEKYYCSERSTGFYAERLNLSVNTLNKDIKKTTGKTVSKLIQNRLILEAKRLLFHSDLSVKEIGVYLNFTDSAHFYHFFRKLENCSPSDYRKKMKMYI